MQAPRLLRTLAAKPIGRRSYTGGQEITTLSDFPTPQGSWKTHNDAKQRKYNAQLAVGIGAVIGSVVFGKAIGYLDFHNDYPERPTDIKSYK